MNSISLCPKHSKLGEVITSDVIVGELYEVVYVEGFGLPTVEVGWRLADVKAFHVDK